MPVKIIIFGNSGCGKSTLAKKLSRQYKIPYFDLDNIAWQKTQPPLRADIKQSRQKLDEFINTHKQWIIEGGYADLISLISDHSNELIFLNPGSSVCIKNCKSRPWEPHKYSSIEAQNKNLNMLIDWLKLYPVRQDEFSLTAHRKIFDEYKGKKTELVSGNI